MRGFSYSNVVATLALFIALGGTAFAVSNNSVKSKHIVNGEVKSADVKAEGLKGSDVEDGSLTVDDIDSYSFNWKDLPVGGAVAAQVREIGAGGETTFGGISGRTSAVANVEDVYMALPLGVEVDSLFAWAEGGQMTAGQSRTISVVGYPNLIGGAGASSELLQCTIEIAQASCDDPTPSTQRNGTFAIRIESVGAGLDPTDDLYVGFAVKALHDYQE